MRAIASSAASIPTFVAPGLEIATRLILELCGGEPSEIVIAGAVPDWRRSYTLPRRRARATLGGARCAGGGESQRSSKRSAAGSTERAAAMLAVEPPSWRGDIEGEADLVEEVLRIHGYDQIPAVPLPRETRAAASRR